MRLALTVVCLAASAWSDQSARTQSVITRERQNWPQQDREQAMRDQEQAMRDQDSIARATVRAALRSWGAQRLAI